MDQLHNLTIRDARADEREAIWQVTRAAYEEYAIAVSPQFWETYSQNIRATLSKEEPVERIVAELSGVLVGSVLLYPPASNAYSGNTVSANWPEVRLLAVVPSARGQGIGRALMEECKRRARNMGATALGLHSMESMKAAIHMYQGMGFVHVPELDFHPASGIVVKGYRLDLNDATLESKTIRK